MANSDLLKEKLFRIKENNFLIDDSTNVFEISLNMMQYIGSVDAELRDNLIYSTFNRWTINGVYTCEQMRQLLNICLDEEHLFYKIGEKETDSVFTRTFSVLIIPLAMYLDSTMKFLTKDEIKIIKEKLIKYVKLEKDCRGYVECKGWAHSTAHVADALEDVAKSDYINHDELLEILDAIKMKICISDYTYINKEDERMVKATLSVFNRKLLKDDEIIKWIKSFANKEKTGKYPEELFLIANIKLFLRSLYFEMMYQKDTEIFTEIILDALQKL